MDILINYLSDIQNNAVLTYNVDPVVFLIIYLLTTPPYYYGDFLMIREGHKSYKGIKKEKGTFRILDIVHKRNFIKGFIVNRLSWLAPYIYVFFFGANIPSFIYILFFIWLIFTTFLFLTKSHHQISRTKKHKISILKRNF